MRQLRNACNNNITSLPIRIVNPEILRKLGGPSIIGSNSLDKVNSLCARIYIHYKNTLHTCDTLSVADIPILEKDRKTDLYLIGK